MTTVASEVHHVRPANPLHFPSSHPEWELPESKRHARLCELLYDVLSSIAGGAHAVGADQFVYFDAANPKRCLAPDAFLKLGVADSLFPIWRSWEHGAPELCVEILSPSDTKEFLTLEKKLERYKSLGTRELVIFDVEAPPGSRLRVLDRIEDDLVERVVENERSPSIVLGELGGRFTWVVAPGDDLGDALRLTRDGVLVPTDAEEQQAALARVAELEREVGRLRGK
jgi:Uma2 family endonuclease